MNKHKHKLENDSEYSDRDDQDIEEIVPKKGKKRKVNPS